MLHAHPLWREDAMLLAKWYTGTREMSGKRRNEVSRRGGWSKWNMTTSSYPQQRYCSLTTFNILKWKPEWMQEGLVCCGTCVQWHCIVLSQMLWFAHKCIIKQSRVNMSEDGLICHSSYSSTNPYKDIVACTFLLDKLQSVWQFVQSGLCSQTLYLFHWLKIAIQCNPVICIL